MLNRLCDRFDDKKARLLRQNPDRPAAALTAHLQTAFGYLQEHKRISAGILAAGANDPRLLEPIRQRIAAEVAHIQGTPQQVARALVVLLAADGLWYNELLDILSLTRKVRQNVLAELLTLAETTAQSQPAEAIT